MATVLFVHGTGVRGPSYLATFEILKRQFETHGVKHNLEPCLWGDDLGSRIPTRSIPDVVITPHQAGQFTEDQNSARWELLYKDPLFELQLLKNRPNKGPIPPANSTRPDIMLWNRVKNYSPSPRLSEVLGKWHLDSYWPSVWKSIILDDKTAEEVLTASPDEVGEPSQALARALVASLTIAAEEDRLPLLDGDERDELVNRLIDDWKARVAGVGTFLARFFAAFASKLATPIIRRKRGGLSESASPAAGDVLLYQVRGGRIREYIRTCVERLPGDVVLLAHSLGGIACVDLLVSNQLPSITHLITAGSQSPLLCEIGALHSINPDAVPTLPSHFPRWLNLYDPNDFLSYVAEPVFQNPKIRDVKIESRQPFPQSHGAYWTNTKTWNAINSFLK